MRFQIAAMLMATGLVLTSETTAFAQGGLEFRPIDTNKLVVQPTDAATNIFSGTSRMVTRSIASMIETNGVVRTVNNIFSRESTPPPTQPGMSPLPHVGLYPSTRYKSPLVPAMPTYQRFGQTPSQR
jgi:hypothetical protein